MSDEPFDRALARCLTERGWSQRELSRRLRDRFGRDGAAHSTVRLWLNGDLHPTREAIERVATVLEVAPDHFAEYRLEVMRDRLNWRKLGVRKAVRELREIDRDE